MRTKLRSDGLEEEMRIMLHENQYAFVALDTQQAKDNSRNDPCPCESARKYKDCHEAQAKERMRR